MTAIIFFLKTQGRQRGYIERKENWNFDFPAEMMQQFLRVLSEQGIEPQEFIQGFLSEARALPDGEGEQATDDQS